ncbi:MAG: 4-phosphoerythronate dehydrogenase [Muribaculaceae bacterium]|nr:4-phosphoerythronate dehydrogenase [Muribaculaceae bacterium]
MKILIESKVPFLRGLLEPYATVDYADPGEITAGRVRDVDGMIVRTRTRCDEALLGASRCSFVATATIGTDHIDLPWCAARGIEVANAPGCNAPAVGQYVFGSVAALIPGPLEGLTLGVVGVGHVGSVVARWGRSLGMRVMLCDPPRQRAEGGDCWCSLADIAREADIVTMHTPLTRAGADATFHLADAAFFGSLQRRPVFINAARGPVADNEALASAISSGLVSHAVVDCWEGEPHISPALLALASVATPHIAGYSREGKWRASQMALDALVRHFSLPRIALRETAPHPVPDAIRIDAVRRSYNPLLHDTPALRSNPADFERLRNEYDLRTEL